MEILMFARGGSAKRANQRVTRKSKWAYRRNLNSKLKRNSLKKDLHGFRLKIADPTDRDIDKLIAGATEKSHSKDYEKMVAEHQAALARALAERRRKRLLLSRADARPEL